MGSRVLHWLMLACVCGAAQAAPPLLLHDRLTLLAKDITYTTAALFPTQATQLGIAGHDAELDTPTETNRAAYIAKLQHWQKQLDELGPFDTASLVDRHDALLLRARTETSITWRRAVRSRPISSSFSVPARRRGSMRAW